MEDLKKLEQLTVYDEEGNEQLCNILFTYESPRTGKNFVVFYPANSIEDDEDEQIELQAALFTETDDHNGCLDAIEDDADWDEIEEAIGRFEEEMLGEEGCSCGCGCEEDDCEEECCCCHHEEE